MTPRNEELWFMLRDVRNLLSHLRERRPAHGQPPALRLWAQGRLRCLDTNTADPQLINPFDPATTQRVYAYGHAHHDGNGITAPATQLIDRPMLIATLPVGYGSDTDAVLNRAEIENHDTLSITILNGQPHPSSHLLPRPQTPGRWHTTEVALLGVPGTFRGQYLDNVTADGYAYVRLPWTAVQQLRTALGELRELPAGVASMTLPDLSVDRPGGHGWYPIGNGWPWVCPELVGPGTLLPYLQTLGDDHGLPQYGQNTFTTSDMLLWLDQHGSLLSRTMSAYGQPHPGEAPAPIDYASLPVCEQLRLRAIEYTLRTAAATTTTVTGLAALFSPAEIEELILAAAQLATGPEPLTGSQNTLIQRVHTALDQHI
ncbi:hypothetical protein AB0B31_11150 [Catellatospora citrea]|uniref:hypothetical protein n=1 Tax=Catellatospora citrea TaxID=53366 RepID=UPI0033EE98C3